MAKTPPTCAWPSGTVSEADPLLDLDEGILRTVWMTADEIRAQPHRMRSPLVIEVHQKPIWLANATPCPF